MAAGEPPMRRPPEWTGDLADDCNAIWGGFMLRAEQMTRAEWWWCVYDVLAADELVASSNFERRVCRTGEAARAAAELAARRIVESAGDADRR
jgi:hypothetical protein